MLSGGRFVGRFVFIRRYGHSVDFTRNNYNVRRKNFAKLQDSHVQFFKELLGESRVVTETSELEKYNVDWMNIVRGSSSLALKPKTTQEVSEILNFCNSNKLAVCPQGGNTAITGGAVPVFDEIVLSLQLMNQILELDENSGVVLCQSGCILENLSNALEEHDLIVPLDLGAKGSCMIGGNLAANAGGLRLLRYGNLHGNVLGVEAVTANGKVMDCLSRLKKDNTGYHMKHLFIGSEGTLGVITKVAIQCPQRPRSINVSFLGLQSYENALKVFRQAKRDLGEILSAFEVIDEESLIFTKEKLGITSPIGHYPFYLLLETSGSNQEHDSDKLNKFLEKIMQDQLIDNGTIASDPGKVKAIWNVREMIPQGFKHCALVLCYDFSLPLEHYYNLVHEMRQHLGDRAIRVFGFGHMGDGNLHLQIELPEYNKETIDLVEPYVFKRVGSYKGSISAEHGMGFLKANYLGLARTENAAGLMRDLKGLLDPNGILNPYKVFPWKTE